MATKRIHAGAAAPAAWSGSAPGFAYDSDNNVLYGNVDGTRRPYASDAVSVITASATATAKQSGTTFVANSTTSVVVTLPSTAAGLRYRLVVRGLTTSGGHAFSPAAADKIMGNGTTAVDNKDIICSAATDREGDAIEVIGDGVDGWYIQSVSGTWAAEA